VAADGFRWLYCANISACLAFSIDHDLKRLVAELTPNGREARAFGFFYTVTIGADAIAPTLYGRVADGVGLSGTILLVATVVLLILPLLAVLRPTIEEHRQVTSVNNPGRSLGLARFDRHPGRRSTPADSCCTAGPLTLLIFSSGAPRLRSVREDKIPMSQNRDRLNKVIAIAINPGAYEQEAIAALRKARTLVNELANGSAPKSASLALNVGSTSAALTSLVRIVMISRGVPTGAPMPSQLLAS
jgi:hypothetical protein